MNKKIIALVLAVLAMVSVLAACTNSNTNETTPATTAKEEGIPTLEQQFKALSIIDDNIMHNSYDPSAPSQSFMYAATDLDNDGMVDLISSACLGTGLFTESNFYEATENGRGLYNCNPVQVNRESEPDIMVDSTDCYENPETGERFYIYTDVVRTSASEIFTAVGWYTFRDNEFIYEAIATETISGDTTTYKSSTDDEVITEEDFNCAVEKYFEGYTKLTATFGWTPFVDENGTPANELSREDRAKAFAESYAKFSVK